VKLTPAKDWIQATFDGGVGADIVRTWILEEIIPGRIIGSRAFVDAEFAEQLLDENLQLSPGLARAIDKPKPIEPDQRIGLPTAVLQLVKQSTEKG